MTTDYDRISADDLTQQTEEQLDQTEGGQTTGPVKTARKKATSSAKPASAKRTSKKRSQKTPAGQGAAEARAQAKRLADQQDILHQRIQTIFERGAAPNNGKRKRAAKAEATGLVWTLSALALAACGGGGGGGSSPAPVTGGEGRSSGPQPVVGGGNLRRETSETVANEVLSAADQKGLKSQLSDMTQMTVSLDKVKGAKTEDFTATGAYQVRTDQIDPNKMISVEVGGIIDPTTGVQVRGGGTGADGKYEGPSNWYILPGSLLVTPITNYLARKYALEMHRDSLKTDNENSRLAGGKDAFFQIILDELFAGSGITVTLDDVLNPVNYILPNKAEFNILNQARAGLDPAADRKTVLAEKTQLADGSELSGGRTLADLDVADIVARKSLELFIHDLEGFADLAERPTRDKDLKDKLDELIQMARDIEDGKPLAIPLPGRTVAEDSADGYPFKSNDFGFSDPGGNDPDPDGNPQTDDAITSQFSAVRFVTASGRDDVARRPDEAGNPVSAADITYDDYGRLYLKTYDSHNQLQDKSLWRALNDGDEVSVADIRAGNLVFIPAADFDRTAEFEIQVFDGEAWSSPVRLFITVQPADDAPEFYSKATPPDAVTDTDGDGRTKTLAKKHTQPLEVVAADGGVNLFAYQALADDADTKDSFAGITYALKRPADGEAETDDSALFVINADTGEVHFKVGEITLSTGEVITVSAPDFERSHDLNLEPGLPEEVKGQRPDGSWHSDGTYVFTVIATSPDGSSVEQTVYLTVQNRNDEVTAHDIGSDHYLTLAAGEYLEVVKAGGEGWQGIPGSNPRTFESHIRINSQASDPSATVLFAYGSAAENDGGQWFIIEMNKDGVLQLNTNINFGTYFEVPSRPSGGAKTSLESQSQSSFEPVARYKAHYDDFAASDRPSEDVQHILGEQSFSLPATGPLTLRWAFDFVFADNKDTLTNRLDTPEKVAEARTVLKAVFAEFEAAANLKFEEATLGQHDFSFRFHDGLPDDDPGTFGQYDIGKKVIFLNNGPNHPDIHGLVVHEVGHALGLSHNFEKRSGWLSAPDTAEWGEKSVMSYYWERSEESALKQTDIDALQFLYGAPGTNFDGAEKRIGYDKVDFSARERVSVAENHDITQAVYDADFRDKRVATEFRLAPDSYDNHLFRIDADTGEVFFRASPDFETPQDSYGGAKYADNNIYQVRIEEFQVWNSQFVEDRWAYNEELVIFITDVAEII